MSKSTEGTEDGAKRPQATPESLELAIEKLLEQLVEDTNELRPSSFRADELTKQATQSIISLIQREVLKGQISELKDFRKNEISSDPNLRKMITWRIKGLEALKEEVSK